MSIAEPTALPENWRERKKAPGEYRQWLVAAEQKGQDDFDKAVLSLSGGALGVSFIFIKDIVGDGAIELTGVLLSAWICWAASSGSVLASFFMSNLALRKAVQQCDQETIYCEPPGGFFTWATKLLNASGAALFFAGVFLMAFFVHANLSTRNLSHERKQTDTAAATAATGPVSDARPHPSAPTR